MSTNQSIETKFNDFLKINKISVNTNKLTHKAMRVAKIEQSGENGVAYMIFVQFDSFFFELLNKASKYIKEVVEPQIESNNCPRCKDGKCSVTMIRLSLQVDEEMEFAKVLLRLRCESIENNRVPKCNYIKLSDRDKRIPCHKCKICNPACRAMKNF